MKTRTEKYEELRKGIAIDNLHLMLDRFEDWRYIQEHQKEIKKEIGAKH